MSRNIAIILAGGKGSRMGLDRPKQFLKIAGLTVMERSVTAFEKNGCIDEIAVVINTDFTQEIENMVKQNCWTKVRRILPGGKERYDSSLSAIRAYEGQDVCLLFHDAARPLVTQEIITEVCRALREHRAVGVGIATVDTIMEVHDGRITQVPDRRRLQRMQTPQAFRIDVISEAYRRALQDSSFRATDDCGVVLRYMPEVPVHVVAGDERNMKLTYADDLSLMERIVMQTEPDDMNAHTALRYLPAADNDTPEGRSRYLKAYHKQYLRDMQLALLDILVHVARVCERHDIPYWLDSGTLLGAVRHGGFIPWDDDIDICMPREALPRFIEVARKELPGHLFVQTAATEPEMRLPICKVRNLNSYIVEADDDFSRSYAKGLYVDIFPMHEWPTLPYRFSKRLAKGYCRANAILHTQHTYSWRSTAELFYFGVKRALFHTVWALCNLFSGHGKYYSNTLDNSGNGNRHLRSTIFPLGTIEFEGEQFSAPADVDRYLRDLFGDYMKLPPEDQREGHATFYMSRLV